MALEVIGCGVSEHDADCLCDVVIPHPTGWVGDAIQDMWMGQEIVNLMGYSPEWDDDSIIDYLSSLVYAKDGWMRVKYGAHTNRKKTGAAYYRAEIRRRLQSGECTSIIQVAEDLGLCYDDLMKVLFMGKRYMTRKELESFEQDTLNRRFTSAKPMGRRYNMTFKSTHSLHSYWGVPYGTKESTRPEHEKLIDELIITRKDLSSREIADVVNSKFDLIKQVTVQKVSNRKDYLKKCNRL